MGRRRLLGTGSGDLCIEGRLERGEPIVGRNQQLSVRDISRQGRNARQNRSSSKPEIPHDRKGKPPSTVILHPLCLLGRRGGPIGHRVRPHVATAKHLHPLMVCSTKLSWPWSFYEVS